MKKLFAQAPAYILGRVKNDFVHTYRRKYPVKLPFDHRGEVIARVTTGAEIFFDHDIFNSYVVSEEENVYVLHHGKMTFMLKEDGVLVRNKIYIFEVVEEASLYKKVRLYKIKTLLGRHKRGMFVYEETVEGEGELQKHLRRGMLIVQKNHKENEPVVAEQVASGVYVEVNNALKEITGRITSLNPYVVEDRKVKVFVYERATFEMGETVTVRITGEVFGRYLGSFKLFNIRVGMVADALVKKVTDKAIFVEIDGVQGRLRVNECYKVNTKYVRGVVYKVDEAQQRFEFSVKRYLTMARENELETPVIDLPFMDSDGSEDSDAGADHSCVPFVEVLPQEAPAIETGRSKRVKTLRDSDIRGYVEHLIENDAFPQSHEEAEALRRDIARRLGKEEVMDIIADNMEMKGLRGMFHELVKIAWSVQDMKEIFKKWLEYEKKSKGDTESVKRMAKEYVAKSVANRK